MHRSVCVLVVAFSILAACGKKKEPLPPQQALPCQGTAVAVRERCGCNPVDDRIITRVDALGFRQDVQTSVKACANGKGNLNVANYDIFKADFVGCIEREVTLDEDLKNEMISIIDDALTSVDDDMKAQWNVCYQRTTASE
jgi:hypothetical protein